MDNGDVTIEDLEKYAQSADVKLPKKLYDESTLRRNKLTDIYAKMPSINRDILVKLVADIDLSFKPLADIIYEKETTRYHELVKEIFAATEISWDDINDKIVFYEKLFNIGHSEKRDVPVKRIEHGKPVIVR